MIAVPMLRTEVRELTFRLAGERDRGAGPGTAGVAMDEQDFQAFYLHTARPLRAYLAGASGDPTLADDLLQEAYFRMLRARPRTRDEAHRRNYLFRIATNLLRDHYRRRKPEIGDLPDLAEGEHGHEHRHLRTDMARALAGLGLRDRTMLWLAYVEGFDHREIGLALGLRTASVRPMLFRARQRLARILRQRGITP